MGKTWLLLLLLLLLRQGGLAAALMLPAPLSDFSVSQAEVNGTAAVYIVGGCRFEATRKKGGEKRKRRDVHKRTSFMHSDLE